MMIDMIKSQEGEGAWLLSPPTGGPGPGGPVTSPGDNCPDDIMLIMALCLLSVLFTGCNSLDDT